MGFVGAIREIEPIEIDFAIQLSLNVFKKCITGKNCGKHF